ncbi:hypothetical protein J6590_015177 [Homalodisca vitripennis]|nr:hypothetical protein J6590_015177 [Homalodisca vitripennis]
MLPGPQQVIVQSRQNHDWPAKVTPPPTEDLLVSYRRACHNRVLSSPASPCSPLDSWRRPLYSPGYFRDAPPFGLRLHSVSPPEVALIAVESVTCGAAHLCIFSPSLSFTSRSLFVDAPSPLLLSLDTPRSQSIIHRYIRYLITAI